MYIEFEIKKIIQELRDPAKVELAIPKLDKFAKQNPAYNFQTNLKRESEQFCQQVLGQLESFRSGNSWKSTNEDSLGASGQDHSRTSQTDKMAQLKNKLNAVNQGRGGPAQGSLNSSINRQSEFQNKMAMLKQKQSTQIGGSQTMRGTMAAPAG
jgi:carbon monoxide dehydrogenase subunit G